MKVAALDGPRVSVASPRQVRDAGAITGEAYAADRLTEDDDPYMRELRDAERRAAEAVLLVATVPGADGAADAGDDSEQGRGVVVGTITLAPAGTSYAEVAAPGEVELRMLAVAPEARGRGTAEALVRAALREAVVRGARRVVLSSLDEMLVAQRLYARLGFTRRPERDWSHEHVRLRVWVWEPPDAPGAPAEVATWPPVRTVVTPHGWRVGLSSGFTRRANSALPPAGTGLDGPAVAAGLDEVEAAYAQAGLPAVVRVPAGRPVAELDARGYAVVSETDVQVRGIDGLPAAQVPSGVRLAGAAEPDDAWLRAWLGVKSAGTDTALARRLLTGAPSDYLTARDASGAVLGVIRAARVEDWVGLSCLVVAPAARRLGLGRALTLHALESAADRGAARAFLQVEVHNGAAARLYGALGFATADAYVYRERPLG
ncbi:GNAT family N-acetyltransferase [Cellulomonas massiliensis]|uniref:GNAT family N-acetyltransferase n=1 Tax=Cellulomonas massiliensis TaxID=1465811 RepID=UPI0002F5E3CA|nr:GNAT family N-acetyltransferase [Cellulomonas massiliensis]